MIVNLIYIFQFQIHIQESMNGEGQSAFGKMMKVL